MSDKFQLLLKQIRFPEDHDAFKEIKDGSIETVKLFKSKRQWFFVFSFPSVLSYESFSAFLYFIFSPILSPLSSIHYDTLLDKGQFSAICSFKPAKRVLPRRVPAPKRRGHPWDNEPLQELGQGLIEEIGASSTFLAEATTGRHTSR